MRQAYEEWVNTIEAEQAWPKGDCIWVEPSDSEDEKEKVKE